MLIDKLEFKNINSYGNNIQTLEFDDEGGLILLTGGNGYGKSTIKQSLELCLFGKVQGKSGKRLALTKLPNRRNGNLYTGVYFKNNGGSNVIMKRYIKPNNFEMFVNEEPYEERFKVMSEKEREKLIGYNYEVFKSFISLNMNDFKNFISLSKEDKENLLNKLFNLNDLDTLFSITKELDNNNQKLINELDNDIYYNEQSILEYKQTIIKIKNTKDFSKEERMKEIKEILDEKKPIYKKYIEDIKECDKDRGKSNIKIGKLNTLKSVKNQERTKLEVEVETIEEKVETYEGGKCPVCETILTDDTHIEHLEKFKQQILEKNELIVACDKYLERCVLEDAKIKNVNSVIYNKKINTESLLSTLKIELGSLNNEYKLLKVVSKDDESINTLKEKIDKLKENNTTKQILLDELSNKSETYEKLKNLFSIDGVRKSMIKNTLIPINNYLNDFLKDLESEYHAKLNENFDATIYELGILEIDPETLSKGEDKKINIAIALSYLEMVLELKHSNIMFFDEIFDGIDVENIDLTLKVLKKIAIKHKINIIIVNHGTEQIANMSIFNKIIKTEKDIFSQLEVIKN